MTRWPIQRRRTNFFSILKIRCIYSNENVSYGHVLFANRNVSRAVLRLFTDEELQREAYIILKAPGSLISPNQLLSQRKGQAGQSLFADTVDRNCVYTFHYNSLNTLNYVGAVSCSQSRNDGVDMCVLCANKHYLLTYLLLFCFYTLAK